MTKKIMTIAEVELIILDANDIVTASFGSANESEGYNDTGYEGGFAPSRYNYRGMATDWEE